MMVTIGQVYNKAIKDGKQFSVLSSDLRLLIAHNEGLARQIDVLLYKDRILRNPQLFDEQFARLSKGEPVEYILNEAMFLDYKLYVDPRVLIPRPETEELVANLTETISDYYDPRNYLVVADIGTGSGAIAIAIKDIFKNWVVIASDINQDALDVARQNIKSHNLQITTMIGPSLQPYIDSKTNLDIILCNPPYLTDPSTVQESVKQYEPSAALWLTKGQSVYEDLFRNYAKVKKGSLLMAFEIDPDLADWLTTLMKRMLIEYEYKFVDDIYGIKRFLFVFCK